MELYFLELGVNPSSFLAAKPIIEALTTPSLIQSSMIFLTQFHIILKHSISIPLLREKDQFINEAFLYLDIPIQDLVACNRCLLYLKVCLLSEIATGTGDAILEDAWAGIYEPQEHKDKSWPAFPKPPPSAWSIWRLWVTKAFLSRGRKLRTPLGQWLQWDDEWKWYYTDDGSLYSLTKGQWYSHAPIIRRNRWPMFFLEGGICSPPPSPKRASVYFKGNGVILTGSARIKAYLPIRASTFLEHLSNVTSLRGCTHSLAIKNDGKDLADALLFGLSATIMAVSDGSFKDLYGTAAWTIGTDENEHIVSGRAICSGGPASQSAYRSKLTGLYAILAVLHQACLYFDVQEGNVQIGCDGLSALQHAFEREPFLPTDFPDYDLLGAIYHLRKISKVTWSHRHVKGHQDDHSTELDQWASLNVQMDAQAKSFLPQASWSPRHYDIEGEPWQLWIQGSKITKEVQTQLYAAVYSSTSEAYWVSKPNGILHENENLVTRSMTIQLNARVSRVYTDLSSRALRHNDRHLLYHSLTVLLKKDTNYKVQWLSVAEPALSESRLEAWRSNTRTDHMVQGMRCCMFSWLRN
jgi:hypothetical protein